MRFLNGKETIQKVQKHDQKTIESFLSCSVENLNNSKNLQNQNLENVFVQRVFSSVYSVFYRASCTKTLYGFSKNTLPDGLSASSCNNEKSIYVLGIDPGNTGAIAVLELNGKTLSFVSVYDFPTYELKTSKTKKNTVKRIDLTALSSLIDLYSPNTEMAMIEDVGFMTGKEARGSAFTFGFATGAVHGILAFAGIKILKVKPSVWKCSLGLGSDKSESVKLAIKLFPESSRFLKRKQDHDRAEAILLAWFAAKNMRNV